MSQLKRIQMRWATPVVFVLFFVVANVAVAAQQRGEASRFLDSLGAGLFFAIPGCAALGLWRLLARREARATAERMAQEQAQRDLHERSWREQEAAQARKEQEKAEAQEKSDREQEAAEAAQEEQRARWIRRAQETAERQMAETLRRNVALADMWAASPDGDGMPFRFCPPPGWPPAPAGWVPDRRWKPGPGLPPPPPGWRLWERTVPRPRALPVDPYGPAPAWTTYLADLDMDAFRASAADPDGRAAADLQARTVRERLCAARANMTDESTDRYHVSGQRSRLHPLEYAYERALDDGIAAADQVQQAALMGAPDGEGLASAWHDLHVALDELADANAERLAEEVADDDRLAADGFEDTAGHTHAWQQAEELAARRLREWGHDEAAVTGGGTDRGVDVLGRAVAAQVKYTSKPVGRPKIQELNGAAGGRLTAFFARSGFSAQAVEEADQTGMALFRISLPMSAVPVNLHARRMSGLD